METNVHVYVLGVCVKCMCLFLNVYFSLFTRTVYVQVMQATQKDRELSNLHSQVSLYEDHIKSMGADHALEMESMQRIVADLKSSESTLQKQLGQSHQAQMQSGQSYVMQVGGRTVHVIHVYE